jgi:hypothetical protein
MSSTKCGVSACDREASIMRRSWPIRICYTVKENHRLFYHESERIRLVISHCQSVVVIQACAGGSVDQWKCYLCNSQLGEGIVIVPLKF